MPLTDVQVRNAKASAAPYELTDGNGMFLLIQPNGAKYWRLSYRFLGKQKTLAFGVYPAVTLATARKKRDEAREQIAAGIVRARRRRKPDGPPRSRRPTRSKR
ncbi:integrase [Burkholderia diffusa]|uniref:Integrase n=1 Tax=Burkholderia diffusa TaxID=488732 RepID=A0A6P2LUF6_9BURK|nr:integrase [Burkholderia diffusa]